MKSAPMRGRVAFTLIELMVVIAVIAVLASVLLPALGKARSQTQKVACRSSIRQIVGAAVMYADDWKVFVGYAAGTDRKMLLYPYLKQGQSNSDLKGIQVWNCLSNQHPAVECGYGFNTNMNWVALNQVRSPTTTVALCDSGLRDGNQPTLSTMCNPPSKTSTMASAAYRPNPRHSGATVNVGFLDSHVEAMAMSDPFYPGAMDKWVGNGVTDPTKPDYKDQLWDLQ